MESITGDDSDLRLSGDRLHERLLNGDVTASAEIVELFLPRIVQRLNRRFPNLHDPNLVDTAADDALLSYIRDPHKYNPTQLPLDKYLTMSARGDLLNLLRREQNQGAPKTFRLVEIDAPRREHSIDVKDESLSLEEQALMLASPVWTMLGELLPDAIDHEMALLILEGVRDTNEYAQILNIGHLSSLEQAAEVKRHKDRIKKILQRRINRSELDENT